MQTASESLRPVRDDALKSVMETASERRRRRLRHFCAGHGLQVVAEKSGLSAAYLDQIIKATPLPKKRDGSRSIRNLGNTAVQAIEAAFELGEGWFDLEEPPSVNDEAMKHAVAYDKMSVAEQQRFRLLMLAARDDPDDDPAPGGGGKKGPRGPSLRGKFDDSSQG